MRAAAWVLLWLVLLAGSAWYLWRRLRALARAAAALTAQLAQAEQLLSARPAGTDAAPPPARTPAPLAVFVPVATAREDHRAQRRRAAAARRDRRRARRPAWTRPVD